MELYISVMAGFVLAAFLIAAELAALRKRLAGMAAALENMRRSGQHFKRIAAICGIAAFFLIQPVVVALLVAAALGQLDTNFSAHLLREIAPR